MSEEILSNEERNAILGQVFKPAPVTEKKDFNTPKKSSGVSEGKADLSQPTFGELLEQTIAIREKHLEEDREVEKYVDTSRAEAIKNSRMDILEGWRL